MRDLIREDSIIKYSRVKFHNYPGSVKYHLVTRTSAYPSTVFQYPNYFDGTGQNLVVPEIHFDSANLPFTDTSMPI
jgi:hypothetical protein